MPGVLDAGWKDGEREAHLMALPAYDQCIKASHVFNLLDARGVISVTERQSYILRVRELAKACGEAWLQTEAGGAAADGRGDYDVELEFSEHGPAPSLRVQTRAAARGRGWAGAMTHTPQRPADHRVPRARALRRDPTEAEKKLWQHLRQPPFKEHYFRRRRRLVRTSRISPAISSELLSSWTAGSTS